MLRILFIIVTTNLLYSCNTTPSYELKGSFSDINRIDPSVYNATEENKANDPYNELTEMFRKMKRADMIDSLKPRPLKDADIGPLENISHQQAWTPIEYIFKFDWDKIDNSKIDQLSQGIKTRLIFDNADLKVVEIAIAPKAALPMHAQANPSVYHILGGEAEVLTGDTLVSVHTGTSIKFDSYEAKQLTAAAEESVKVLWFSWAPNGDDSYLKSGYYLTGSNIHIQPIEAVLPEHFDFWDTSYAKPYELLETIIDEKSTTSEFINQQKKEWLSKQNHHYYDSSPSIVSAGQVDWVDVVNLDPKSFFFANDIKKLGAALNMLGRLAKIKSVFRVHRPDGGYDLNYSYLAWGPQSKYVTHSHAICEFYYLLEGNVEYIINKEKFHAVPGNFYFHPPYYDHEMLGLEKDIPFLAISGSWVPYGDRSLFDEPFLLLEDIHPYKGPGFSDNFRFHDFKINREQVYGALK